MKKLLTVFLLLCLLVGCLGCTQPVDNQPQGQFIVHFIDLGQSDSILLEYEGHFGLIDGGYANTSDKLLDYLEDQDVEKLDLVVSTHMHGDHIGGLPAVLEAYEVGVLWHSRQTYYSDAYDKLLYYADQQDTLVEKPVVTQLFLLGDVQLELLGPLQKSYTDINNSSLVIMASYGENRFLFTGDMRHEAEKELVEAGTNLKADVLKVGHHGSYTSTSYLFLRTVQPDYAVIQCGRNNEYGHPHSEPMSRLRDADVDIYRNDKLGTVIAVCDGKNITFSWEFADAKPEYNK
ncbi:MAG: MBL fold metallo-hydrolase [Ruminococcaceae bacterium]|nr:MBL fold metallo-hydrolase [Oscillospiraceae bacterium]